MDLTLLTSRHLAWVIGAGLVLDTGCLALSIIFHFLALGGFSIRLRTTDGCRPIGTCGKPHFLSVLIKSKTGCDHKDDSLARIWFESRFLRSDTTVWN